MRARVVLQKLINFDPTKDEPIFAQHHSAKLVHKDDEHINEDNLIQRQKLLAKEPEVPEMYVDYDYFRQIAKEMISLNFF